MQAWLASLEAWPAWLQVLIPTVGAVILALLLHAVVWNIGRNLASRTDMVADEAFLDRTRNPARWLFAFGALELVILAMPLSEALRARAWHAAGLGFIAAVTWFLVRAISVADDVVEAQFPLDAADNLRARQVHTQARVLTRTAMILTAVVGVSAILMTFPSIRALGTSLLASAGVAGLVIGLAARPAVSNLIAGLQIALTQPIRLDDVVIVEGEWGRIEQITSTFVVLRIWDQRRLVLPLQHFIEKPFQNWTRSSAEILGTVFLWVDYTVSVEAMRAELKRIVEGTDLWDGRVVGLVVTDTSERAMQVRALVSAADSGRAWDLRCKVREELIGWLQREHPESLPRLRIHS